MARPVYIFIYSECLAHGAGKRRAKVGIRSIAAPHLDVMREYSLTDLICIVRWGGEGRRCGGAYGRTEGLSHTHWMSVCVCVCV